VLVQTVPQGLDLVVTRSFSLEMPDSHGVSDLLTRLDDSKPALLRLICSPQIPASLAGARSSAQEAICSSLPELTKIRLSVAC
jgi:hypothetical protein